MAAALTGRCFERLKAGVAADWRAYVDHDFVRQLGRGTLPEPCFRHYLVQDYLFLLHFGRAYALGVYKSDTLEEMRQCGATMDALVNGELKLHVDYCRSWGLDEAAMAATQEAPANMAYTRYVLEAGLSGDLLDLLAALSPCVVGYAEIGQALLADPETTLEGNPYKAWIEAYSGEEYQGVARDALAQLDRVAERRLGPPSDNGGWDDHPRWAQLTRIFGNATRLEVGFWDMGLAPTA